MKSPPCLLGTRWFPHLAGRIKYTRKSIRDHQFYAIQSVYPYLSNGILRTVFHGGDVDIFGRKKKDIVATEIYRTEWHKHFATHRERFRSSQGKGHVSGVHGLPFSAAVMYSCCRSSYLQLCLVRWGKQKEDTGGYSGDAQGYVSFTD